MTQVSFFELNYDGDRMNAVPECMAGVAKHMGRRMLASRTLVTEPPLASYLNLLSQVDFLLPTLKRPRSRGRESIVVRHHQEEDQPSVSTACRDSMRTVRRSALAMLRFLF